MHLLQQAAVALTYLREKSAGLIGSTDMPALQAPCGRCEAMKPFRCAAYSAAEVARSGWQPVGTGYGERSGG